MRREELRLRTRRLAVCALLVALGEVILALGALTGVADLSAVALTAFFVVYTVIEMKQGYAWSVWLVTAGLAWLLIPAKETALLYTALGYYPLVKRLAERLRRIPEWIVKIVWVGASGAAALAISHYLLTPEANNENRLRLPIIALFAVVALAAFIVYDILLTRLITIYLVRWRDRFRIR